jgi:hypothetical protein
MFRNLTELPPGGRQVDDAAITATWVFNSNWMGLWNPMKECRRLVWSSPSMERPMARVAASWSSGTRSSSASVFSVAKKLSATALSEPSPFLPAWVHRAVTSVTHVVRGARGEVSFEQVGRDGVVVSRVGRGPKTPPSARHQARFTHDMGDLPGEEGGRSF